MRLYVVTLSPYSDPILGPSSIWPTELLVGRLTQTHSPYQPDFHRTKNFNVFFFLTHIYTSMLFTLTYPVLAGGDLSRANSLTHVRHEKLGLIWMPNHLASVTGIKAGFRHFLCLSWGLQFVRLGEHCRPRPGVASYSVWSDSIMFREVPIL